MQAVEGAAFIRAGHDTRIEIALDADGTLPPGMVRVEGDTHSIDNYALASVQGVKLEGFLLDKYEVTNRQYKEFVDAGGYLGPRYWKHEILDNGQIIPWKEAVRRFVDSTGRPGPAVWALGVYPEGAAEHPVTGVSWYEATAYAEYAGKQLPSVFHWHHAAVSETDSSFIISQSNLDGQGLVPVGAFKGLGFFGTYDMAGNAKEWCWNESEGKRSILGGAWNDAQYWFVKYDCYPPLMRESNFGFRCMKTIQETGTDGPAFRPLEPIRPPDYRKMAACPDEVFEVYRSQYSYMRTKLEPQVESRLDWSEDTTIEKVSFAAASGGSRVIAYLFLPKRFAPPYQSVVYFPGESAQYFDSIYEYGPVKSREIELYPKGGRVFVFPVLEGTFERRREGGSARTPQAQRERWIRLHRELCRCLDYLETRAEFDKDKISYQGLSWGAWSGPIHLALEKRFKAGVLLGGGLYIGAYQPDVHSPEWDPVNFAPRVKIPILMQNGVYDVRFPLESSARGLFHRLGTPEKDKRLVLYPTGHSVWLLNEYRRDTFDFLDKYLGPVKRELRDTQQR